ncbi:winged helix DNA-binding domain-containing protein [Nonomuraea sp. NPDC050328]|uniref:winged helix DNA-binding domain-containing protein n=1 Tax=Nonomuraea sp. NPDC050328 TaxID=3364361 RepID=UPI0037AF438D
MNQARTINAAERRARLGVRHALAARVDSVAAAAEAVVALHATDPATVYLSAGARVTAPALERLERELYDGSLVRLHGMRRTVFVVPAELAPVVHVSSTAAIAARERKQLLKHLAEGGLTWSEAELADVEASVVKLVEEHGEISVNRLGVLEPRLREQLVFFPGKPYEARQAIASRLITLLGMEHRIVRRSRTSGTWISGQHNWAPAPAVPELDPRAAQAELVRRWLAAFGPGTEADVKWWTGWTAGDTRKALAAAGAVAVELAEGTGYVLPEDVEPVAEPEPWAALLPALDPAPMGWQQRGFYLPEEHRAPLFDRSGNIGPTVWWNGRIVGGWASRPDGEIGWRLLEDVGGEAEAAIGREAAALGEWLGGAKVTPRFRTPLEKELAR